MVAEGKPQDQRELAARVASVPPTKNLPLKALTPQPLARLPTLGEGEGGEGASRSR